MPIDSPWPRGRDLLGFWPLDSINRLADVSGRGMRCSWQCNGVVDNEKVGPFGQESTSHKTVGGRTGILHVDDVRPGLFQSSFTITFFAKLSANAQDPLISLGSSYFGEIMYFQLQAVSKTPAGASKPRAVLQIRGVNSTDVRAFKRLLPKDTSIDHIGGALSQLDWTNHCVQSTRPQLSHGLPNRPCLMFTFGQ